MAGWPAGMRENNMPALQKAHQARYMAVWRIGGGFFYAQAGNAFPD